VEFNESNAMRYLYAFILITLATATNAQNIEYGKFLSSQCESCHAVEEGQKSGEMIEIRGMPETDMLAKLDAFRIDTNQDSVIHSVFAFLDENEAEALAAYLSSLSPN